MRFYSLILLSLVVMLIVIREGFCICLNVGMWKLCFCVVFIVVLRMVLLMVRLIIFKFFLRFFFEGC